MNRLNYRFTYVRNMRLRTTLQTTGLGVYLDSLRESAARLRQDVLFLGPERLYPAPKLPGGEGKVLCFIVMPFILDIFWLKDDSLDNLCDLPSPDVLQQEIIEHLEAALAFFRDVTLGLQR